MTIAERRDYLRARGWRQIGGSRGAWQPPDAPDHFYSLAAAIRTAIAKDNRDLKEDT
jgi:hypothetical protein